MSSLLKCGAILNRSVSRDTWDKELASTGISWFHNNGLASPAQKERGLEFVPTVTDRDTLQQAAAAAAGAGPQLQQASWLMGFPSLNDMPVTDAVDAWARVVALAPRTCRLVSHSVVSGNSTLDDQWAYMDRMVAGIRERGLRLDAVGVRCVMGHRLAASGAYDVRANAERVLRRVDEAHTRYGLPVWITSLLMSDLRNPASAKESEEFLRLVHDGALRRPHLARYAYHKGYGSESGLLDPDSGGLTAVGEMLYGRLSHMRRGVGTPWFDGMQRAMMDSRSSWFYTWVTGRPGVLTQPTFYPMIFSDRSLNALSPTTVSSLRQQRVILGFNEIDERGQANMTPEVAADTWARVVQMFPQAYLVSPCVAVRAEVAGQPFDRFMTLIRQRGLRVDAVAIHAYMGWKDSPDFNVEWQATNVARYVDRVWDRYRLPVWLTEVGVLDWSTRPPTHATEAENMTFLRLLARELDRRPHLERWAWFELPRPRTGEAYGLADRSSGAVTPLGRVFAELPR
jgi:hypothetical protein